MVCAPLKHLGADMHDLNARMSMPSKRGAKKTLPAQKLWAFPNRTEKGKNGKNFKGTLCHGQTRAANGENYCNKMGLWVTCVPLLFCLCHFSSISGSGHLSYLLFSHFCHSRFRYRDLSAKIPCATPFAGGDITRNPAAHCRWLMMRSNALHYAQWALIAERPWPHHSDKTDLHLLLAPSLPFLSLLSLPLALRLPFPFFPSLPFLSLPFRFPSLHLPPPALVCAPPPPDQAVRLHLGPNVPPICLSVLKPLFDIFQSLRISAVLYCRCSADRVKTLFVSKWLPTDFFFRN